MVKRKQVEIGDIIEIPTAKGLAYAQYTHQHSTHGGLIRVFDGFWRERPHDLSDIAHQPVLFSVFFPVKAAVNKNVVEVISNEQISDKNREFPLFRSGMVNPKTKRIDVWWFWDGEKEWKVGNITEEQRKMPLAQIWNDTMLIQRLEEGWTPQKA